MNTLIERYIKEVAELYGFEDYVVRQKSWKYPDWGTPLNLMEDIAVVVDLSILCSVAIATDFANDLLVIQSDEGRIDYKHLISASDVGGVIQLQSSFLSHHHSTLTMSIASTPIYTNVYSGHLLYYLIKRKK